MKNRRLVWAIAALASALVAVGVTASIVLWREVFPQDSARAEATASSPTAAPSKAQDPALLMLCQDFTPGYNLLETTDAPQDLSDAKADTAEGDAAITHFRNMMLQYQDVLIRVGEEAIDIAPDVHALISAQKEQLRGLLSAMDKAGRDPMKVLQARADWSLDPLNYQIAAAACQGPQ